MHHLIYEMHILNIKQLNSGQANLFYSAQQSEI